MQQKSFDAPDFSEVVGAVINADNADATGLAAVEGNLALWLDAANLNGVSNTGVNDGDAISSWMDLSGNENHAIESDTSKMPTIDNDVFNNMKSIKFDGSDDQLKLTQRALLGKNYTLFIVAQSLAANQESGSLLTRIIQLTIQALAAVDSTVIKTKLVFGWAAILESIPAQYMVLLIHSL